MSNVITREYLVDRYVSISAGWKAELYMRLNADMADTSTVETYDREVFAAVTAEENRQIKAGIQKTLEKNMDRNRITRPINKITGLIEKRDIA